MLIGRGVYSFGEAASLTGLRAARVRQWFRTPAKVGPVFQSDFSGETQQPLISFLDLVDVFIAGQLREHGVSLQTLRRVYKALQKRYAVEHPFCHRSLTTDGRDVFMTGLDSDGREEVIDVLTRQRVFPDVIRPFLKQLRFDKVSNLANEWRIGKGIVINPEICFGQPVIEQKCVPTAIVAKAVRANGNDQKAVADWYGLTVSQVASACGFEKSRAA